MSDFQRRHYVEHLGTPFATHSEEVAGHALAIEGYADIPTEEAVTLASFGLHRLGHGQERAPLNQELVLTVWRGFLTDELLESFEKIMANFASGHEPFSRGDLVRLSSPLIALSHQTYLYATLPSQFDDDFQSVASGSHTIQIRWLIPLYETEAVLAQRVGWDKFEDRLAESGADPFDLSREAFA